jgi:hypothetical protein
MGRTVDQVMDARDGSTRVESYKRRRPRVLSLVPLLLSGVLLTACTGGSPKAANPGYATPTSAESRALAFAKCMRENGVEKFPDPSDGDVIVKKDSGIDPQSAEFKQAEEACKDLSPQGENGEKDGKPADLAKARAWAKCVREHGVPSFPDPKIVGNTALVDTTGVPDSEGGPLDKALETCQKQRPSGNITMRRNGPGQ